MAVSSTGRCASGTVPLVVLADIEMAVRSPVEHSPELNGCVVHAQPPCRPWITGSRLAQKQPVRVHVPAAARVPLLVGCTARVDDVGRVD
jgi:hypothetical protein